MVVRFKSDLGLSLKQGPSRISVGVIPRPHPRIRREAFEQSRNRALRERVAGCLVGGAISNLAALIAAH
jgi:hypothetical protein